MLNNYFGCIYKVTNIQNNKCYVGKTKNFKQRQKSHEKNSIKGSHNYFRNALATYGLHNFRWEILGYCESKEELNMAEIICIEFFQSNNSIYGYNKTKGGDGGDTFSFVSKEKQESRRLKIKLKPRTEEWNNAIGEANKGRVGGMLGKPGIKSMLNKHHTDEAKEKIKQVRLGKTYEEIFGKEKAEQIRKKQSKSSLGKKKSKEHCKNISESKLGIKTKKEENIKK